VGFTCIWAGVNPKGATANNSAAGDYNSTNVANVVNAETLGSFPVKSFMMGGDRR